MAAARLNVRIRPIADIRAFSNYVVMYRIHAVLLTLALGACVTRSGPQLNSDFSTPSAAELVKSFELRDRYNAPKHLGTIAIYVDSVAVHHIYSETSTIVWKDEGGRLQRSQVIEVGPGGLLPIERKLESNETAKLPD